MVRISLVPALTPLYLYVSTFRSIIIIIIIIIIVGVGGCGGIFENPFGQSE